MTPLHECGDNGHEQNRRDSNFDGDMNILKNSGTATVTTTSIQLN